MKVLLCKTFTKMFKVIHVTVVWLISGAFGILFEYIYNNLSESILTYDIFSNNNMNI